MKKKEFVRWQDAEVPLETETYMPVAHGDLFDLVDQRLSVAGYEITSRSVEQSIDGNVVIAHYIIRKDDDIEDFTQEFGVVNSYDKSKAIMFASGGHVFICGNGMVVSEMTTVRKHTSRVWHEINDKLDEAISHMEDSWTKLINDVLQMTLVEINTTQASEILGRMFMEEKILSLSDINKVTKEYFDPTHDYGNHGTLWQLYNHITYVLKDAHIMRKTKALKDTHDFMVEYAKDYININR